MNNLNDPELEKERRSDLFFKNQKRHQVYDIMLTMATLQSLQSRLDGIVVDYIKIYGRDNAGIASLELAALDRQKSSKETTHSGE